MKQYKNIIALILSVLIMFPIAALTASANDADTPGDELKVTVNTNIGSRVNETYNLDYHKVLTVKFNLKTPELIASSQGYITYDKEVLKLTEFTLSDKLENSVVYVNLDNKATFNNISINNLADFSSSGVFATATFTLLKPGNTDINIYYTELTTLVNDVPVDIITDSTVLNKEKTSDSLEISGGSLRVNISSNLNNNVYSQTYDTQADKAITVELKLQSSIPVIKLHGALTCDGDIIELIDFKFLKSAYKNSTFEPKIYPSLKEVNFEWNSANFECPKPTVYAIATFKVLKSGITNVNLKYNQLVVNDGESNTTIVYRGEKENGVDDIVNDDNTPDGTISDIPETQPSTEEPVTDDIRIGLSIINYSFAAGKTCELKLYKTINGNKTNISSFATAVPNRKTIVTANYNKDKDAFIVTGLKKGKTKVKVKYDGKVYNAAFTVINNPTIKINNKKFNSKNTYLIKAKKYIVVKTNGKASSVKNVYKTSNKKIARVVSKATAKILKVKGYKKGKATITVKVNGKAFRIKVKVK